MTLENEDRVELIALMGATGAGKSSFINHVLRQGEQAAEVNDGLESCTSEVTPMPFELDGFRGSIIDTPGFDDTYLSDTQILVKISNWLQMTYQNDVKVTGVLYLRDINEGRVTGSVRKNIRMFEEICGTDSLENVVIVTTKWDIVPRAQGEAREQELMAKFFRPMLDAGAQQARHNDTLKSAQEVLRKVLGNQGRALQLQSELIDGKKTLSQTKAGAVIKEEMTKQYEEHKKEMEELKQQIENERNEKKRLVLQREQDELTHAQALIEQDRLRMDADREQEMREYQARLDAVADKTSSSPTAVLLNGLAVGAAALGPVALQLWQQYRADQANEKQADQAREDKIRQENIDREDRLRREEHDRHVKAKQEETERDLERLRMQVDHQSRAQNNRVPGLLELLFGFH